MITPDTEKPVTPEPNRPELKKDWRFYSGLIALVLALVLPLFALAVPLLGLPIAVSAVLAGGLLAGGPEVLIVLAAILLGKETVTYFTHRAKRLFWEVLLAKPVSKLRYYAGLAIALLSLVPLYLYGYAPSIMPSGDARLCILAAADLSFLVSIFIMGGEFWEKLRRLFVWEGAR